MHLALIMLGIGPGDEVIVPDPILAATINAALHCSATPVMADIDSVNLGRSLEAVAQAITRGSEATLPVHV